MRAHRLFATATAIGLMLTLVPPSDAGQRRRSSGHSRSSGASSGASSGGGQSRSTARSAQPRSGGDRRDSSRSSRAETRSARPERQQAPQRQQAPLRQQPEPRSQPQLRQQPDLPSQQGLRRVPESRSIAPSTSDRNRFPDGQRSFSGTRDRNDRQRWSDDLAGSRVAVPRVGSARRDGDRGFGNRSSYRVYTPRSGRSYRYYTYYPLPLYYRSYAFGYGPGGRGYFYFDSFYDSYVWYPHTVVRYSTYGSYGYPTGELRLQVKPRDAQVFIDGSYAGTVDQFDGIFQSLRLEAGEYRVEIVLPGFEPLDFDVLIRPGEKTTYRGELFPELP